MENVNGPVGSYATVKAQEEWQGSCVRVRGATDFHLKRPSMTDIRAEALYPKLTSECRNVVDYTELLEILSHFYVIFARFI